MAIILTTGKNTSALNTNENLIEFIFENDVDILSADYFAKCKNIKDIVLNNVNNVEDYFVRECNALSGLQLPGPIINYKLVDYTVTLAPTEAEQSLYYLSSLNTLWFYNITDIQRISCFSDLHTLANVYFKDCSCTSLPDYCFANNYNLNNIEFSESITSIGNNAFENNLHLIAINCFNIKKIGSSAFNGCDALKTVILGEEIYELKDSTFISCKSLYSINVNNITSFGSDCFNGCENLNNITLNSIISSLNDRVFYNCSSLNDINIENIKQIKDDAINGCISLQKLNLENVETLSKPLNRLYGLQQLTIPKNINITALSDIISDLGNEYLQLNYLNLNNTSLHNINYEELNNIGSLIALNTLIFPTSTDIFNISFNEDVFNNLSNLYTLDLTLSHIDIDFEFKDVNLSSLNNSYLTTLSVCVKDQNNYILNNVFKNSSKVTDITLSNSYKIISDEFNGCSSLTSLNLINCTNTIFDDNIFNNCNSLDSIQLQDVLTNIPTSLSSCIRLRSLDLPNSIEQLNLHNLLTNLTLLTNIDIPNNCKQVETSCFYRNDSTYITITNPENISNLTSIGDYAFANTKLSTQYDLIVDNSSKINLYQNTFKNCKNLRSININVDKIINNENNRTFENCESLIYVTFNKNTDTNDCAKLKNIINGCKNIATITFSGYKLADFGLTDQATYYEIRDTIATGLISPTIVFDDYEITESGVNEYPLYYTYNQNKDTITGIIADNIPDNKEILIPTSIKTINNNVFNDDYGIKTIVIKGFPNNLNNSGIKNISNLTIKLENIISIPDNIFENYNNIINIIFNSKNLGSIGSNAFSGTIIKSLQLDTSNTNLQLNDNCFNNTKLTNLIFTNLGSTFFNRVNGIFETNKNSNSTNLNIDTLIYTAENPPLEYPTFIVTDNSITCYSNIGELTADSTNSYVKYIPKSLEVDSEGYVLNINQTYIAEGGYIPDDSLFGLTGIRTGALTNKTALHNIIIPSDIGFNNIENDAFKTITPYDLSIQMKWCDFETFRGINNWNQKISDLGISSNTKAKIYLKDAIVYSDGSYDTKATVENEELIVGFFANKYNNNTPEWSLIKYNGLSANFVVPDYITVIHDKAFENLPTLKSINLNNVTTLYENTFNNCENLTSITNYSQLSNIGLCAFTNIGINNFILPNKILELDNLGFNTCNNLTSIIVHNNITAITDNALENCKTIKTLSASNSSKIVKIGDRAFYNTTSLSNINILNNSILTSIGFESFYNAFNKNANISIQLENSVTSITDYCFYDSKINSIEMNPLIIESYAFNKSTLSNLNVGTTLLSIEQNAFADCPKAFNINIPDTIKFIDNNAFENWNNGNNKNIIVINNKFDTFDTLNENLYLDGIDGYRYYDNIFSLKETSRIYNDINTPYIKHMYLYDNKLIPCPSYLSIDLVNYKVLKLIDPEITSIYLPEYLKTIKSDIFKNNKNINTIYCNMNNLKFSDEAFLGCENLERIVDVYKNDDYVKPLELTQIYSKEFKDCLSLDNIVISSNLTELPPSCFYNCQSLNTYYPNYNKQFLDVNNNISSYGNNCFYNCKKFLSLTITDKLQNIDGNIISGCDNLSVININLSSSQFINRLSTATENTLLALFNKHFNCGHKILIKMLDADFDSETGKSYDNGLVIENGVIKYALSPYVRVPNIIIGGAHSIGPYAFTECDYLHEILWYNSKELSGTIGNYAFYNCKELEYLNTRNNELYVSNIGDYAFYNCYNLKSIIIDCKNLTNIGSGAFYGTSINSITLRNTDINAFKEIINWKETNKNPLQLLNTCQIKIEKTEIINGTETTTYELYTYILDDITRVNVGINPNTIIYTDKTVKSVKAVLLVPASTDKCNATGILPNTFHCNIIGRYDTSDD